MSRRHRKPKLPREYIEMPITGLSHEGRGIGSYQDKVVFVRGALPGETVNVQLTGKRSGFYEAETKEVITAAPDRVSPRCEAYGRCGGCCLQHLDHQQQVRFKQNVLKEQLQHFGQVQPQQWLPPLCSEPFGYRHKARLGVRYVPKKGDVLVGFRETNGRYIVDMQRCEVLHPNVGEKIALLRQWLHGLEAKDQTPQIEVAIDDDKTAFIVRHLTELTEHDQQHLIQFAQAHGIWLYLQPAGLDSIHLVWPQNQADTRLRYRLPQHDIEIAFAPQDFTQVNVAMNRAMVDLALSLLALTPEDTVLDAFCGLGNFSLPIARYAAAVIGVEGDEMMTQRAAENAALNHLDNIHFEAADLFEKQLPKAWLEVDKILLDPPRAGAQAFVQQLKDAKAQRIVYISCNPATLARDAGILVNECGYQLIQAGIMDMFPHTRHVESIAVFER